jgi:hypothetical protein
MIYVTDGADVDVGFIPLKTLLSHWGKTSHIVRARFSVGR